MAQIEGTEAIYAMHFRWLNEVLGPGDSLFTPGTAIWTGEHLEELEQAFAGHPDTTLGKRYEEKLRGQLAGVSPGAKQLMAELHAVHFLIIWIGAISAATKVATISTILAWMPSPPDVPADVVEAMSPGLVHPGTWVMTRRDTQIIWLIRFSAAWKQLQGPQQQALAADPWALKEFTGQVKAPSATGAQLGLLHLSHPETFDPVVSVEHKRRITRRFSDVAGDSPDVDRRLLAARAALAPQYGEDLDWYRDWLVRLWLKNDKAWKTFLKWLQHSRDGAAPAAAGTAELLEHGDEAFLDGGIAATRLAWQLAGWGDEPDGSPPGHVRGRLLAFLDEAVRDSQGWDRPLEGRPAAYAAVQHLARLTGRPPGWSDSDWEELAGRLGIPLALEDSGEDGSDAPEGPLVDHIGAAAKKLHVDRSVLDEIKELLDDKGQVVLYGPPGTGKTFLAVELATALADGDENRVSVVQFHPATTYEDFFEGLRPQVTEAGQVTYERTPGPLVRIAEKAAKHGDDGPAHLLVIDEINRANLPKVLGELLFLLENRDKSALTLYRPEMPFRLPRNLQIIGTMNTADRSIALIDAAMRRRFHFVPFFPHDGMMKNLLRSWLNAGNGPAAVADFLDAVNQELLPPLGEHLLIGPSYFMQKTGLSDQALRRIWTYDIFPLIEEHLWGDQDQIRHWRWDAVRTRYATVLPGKPQAGPAPAAQAPASDNPDT